MNESMTQTFTAQIRFKTRVPINALRPMVLGGDYSYGTLHWLKGAITNWLYDALDRDMPLAITMDGTWADIRDSLYREREYPDAPTQASIGRAIFKARRPTNERGGAQRRR
jgi:hypothetical protein